MKISSTALALLFAVGCAPEDSTVERTEQAVYGRMPNGRMPNGRMPNGRMPNGISLVGVRLGGGTLSSTWVEASVLAGVASDGSVLRGKDLLGAELIALLDDGSTIELRLDAFQVVDGDIAAYVVSYYDDALGKRAPLCGSDETGAPIGAIPLPGVWDYRQGVEGGGSWIDQPASFTLACRGYVLAKCVEIGYRPWADEIECLDPQECKEVSLRDYHQACTRMLRADYCGNGDAHTHDGTEIDLYDNLGLVAEDPEIQWPLEAEWTAGGAGCVSRTRWDSIDDMSSEHRRTVAEYIMLFCPHKWGGWVRNDVCGGPTSDFHTVNGYWTPGDVRNLLANESADLSTPEGIWNGNPPK